MPVEWASGCSWPACWAAPSGWSGSITRKSLGLRTNLLICCGCAMFTFLSAVLAGDNNPDKGRVAANIVQGIGFLGRGSHHAQPLSCQRTDQRRDGICGRQYRHGLRGRDFMYRRCWPRSSCSSLSPSSACWRRDSTSRCSPWFMKSGAKTAMPSKVAVLHGSRLTRESASCEPERDVDRSNPALQLFRVGHPEPAQGTRWRLCVRRR